MKHVFILLAVSVFVCACDDQATKQKYAMRMAEVDRKEQELLRKEQELLLKEKALLLKEEQMNLPERPADTSAISVSDTLVRVQPELSGRWNVNMRCIETDCTGSAVGDIKNEQWQFSYDQDKVVAQAFSGDSLVRVYKGTYSNNTLELLAEGPSTPARMIVKIQNIGENKMTGQREIIRSENCRILYTLDLEKL